MKRVMETDKAATAGELLEAVNRMMLTVQCETEDFCANTFATTFVTINSDSLKLELVEETLTDGSKVYNIELTEVSK